MWKSEWRGDVYMCEGNSNAGGVVIMFKQGLKFDQVYETKSGNGRFITLEIKHDNKKLTLVNVYAPNDDSSDFFIELFEKIIQISTDELIIMGDLNILMDKDLDRKGGNPKESNATRYVNDFMHEHDWVDVWRILHNNKFQIRPGFLSDHSFVYLEIKKEWSLRGKGFWKLNTKHLHEKEFVEKVNEIIDYAHYRYDDLDPCTKWECVKCDIREYAILFSKQSATRRKNRSELLTKKLNQLEKKLAMLNLKSPNVLKQIENINDKIDPIKDEIMKNSLYKTQGAILRSKARYMQLGEHSSSYFFNLEKAHAKNKTMSAAFKKDGTITQDSKEILGIQRQFYEELYHKNEAISFEMPEYNVPKLNCEESALLDQQITQQEIEQVIKEMARNKTPGTDSFPVEMYIMFYSKFKDILFEMYQCALQKKKLPISMREGLISLIPKKCKDNRYVKSWRPISLLNLDYKILSKILANRMKGILQKIINEDQNAYIKGRNISENLRRTSNIMEYAFMAKVDVVIVSIDFEKAFDRVEHESMWKILKWFKFGDKFIEMLKVLYNGMCIYTNLHQLVGFYKETQLRAIYSL